MTDWTKDEDEDKFFDWMDKDKQNYNEKHPRTQKKRGRKKKIIASGLIVVAAIILVLTSMSSSNEFGFENYFYIPDYRLNKSPVFCAQEFSDPAFPDANNIMLTKTSNAVQEWQDRIEQYTETTRVWNFEYRVIPERSSFVEFGCDTTITFEQFPSPGKERVRGDTALSHYGFSDVVIFYLDPKSKDKIDSKVDMVIKHEIGHVLGLGHPIFDGMYDDRPFFRDGDSIISRSIMVTPEIYPFLPANMVYSITDYDVRAVVNLYGGGISNTPLFFGYLNYIIIAVLLFGIAFFVNKKLKQ